MNFHSTEEMLSYAEAHTEVKACCGTDVDPLVSVCIVTYNHDKFIAQAIDSVLMQETDFPFEIIIGEDCSTDGTREIVIDYQQRYPDKIRLLLSTENLGKHTGNGRLNFLRNLNACHGKYIALLEGDDYWTDPLKLQKQVDVLEKHDEYSMCFHKSLYIHHRSDGSILEKVHDLGLVGSTVDYWEAFAKCMINTATVVFRRELIDCKHSWFYSLPVGDAPLYCLLAGKGKIGFIDDTMVAYRMHDGGIWSGKSPQYKFAVSHSLVKVLRSPESPVGKKYRRGVLGLNALYVSRRLRRKQRIWLAWWWLLKSVFYDPLFRYLTLQDVLREAKYVTRCMFKPLHMFLSGRIPLVIVIYRKLKSALTRKMGVG